MNECQTSYLPLLQVVEADGRALWRTGPGAPPFAAADTAQHWIAAYRARGCPVVGAALLRLVLDRATGLVLHELVPIELA